LRRSQRDWQPREFAARKRVSDEATDLDCRITDYRVFGNAVTYEMACGKTSIHSKAAYHGDAFEADMTTKAEGAPEVVNHIKAHRLGACHTAPPTPTRQDR
jgi:Protein of unknown function (DUF3617)